MSITEYTKGYSERGADTGRVSKHSVDNPEGLKFYLRKVRLDSGGYDPGGAYWGIGPPALWRVMVDDNCDEEIDYFIRADDREHAKEKVRSKYKDARFFR